MGHSEWDPGLASLCQASRQFNQLATRNLYHTIYEYVFESKWWLLARTLIARRDLAGLVKRLELTDPDRTELVPHSGFLPPEVTTYYASQFALAANAGPTAGPAAGDLTCPDTKGKSFPAIASLLASLCPNLETLQCLGYSDTVAYTFCPPASLPALQRLVVRLDVLLRDDCEKFELDAVFSLFWAAPNIKSLDLNGFTDLYNGCVQVPDGLRLENVTYLGADFCDMSTDTLINLFLLCPNLQHLDGSSGLSGIRPQDVVHAVLAHAPSLTELSFEFNLECWRHEWGSGPEEEFPEYDLQETKQLLDASGRQI